MKALPIKFKKRSLYFVGESFEKGGTLETMYQIKSGDLPFAYLDPSGLVHKFGEPIGTIKNIKVISYIPEEIAEPVRCLVCLGWFPGQCQNRQCPKSK